MSHLVHDMFHAIAGRYDLANDVLSMRMHRHWRREALSFVGVSQGDSVLDLCCGTGDLTLEAARRVGSRGQVVGLDFVQSMLDLAARKRMKQKLDASISFIQGDALTLPFSAQSFDLVTIAFGIRNVDQVSACLLEMRRVLRPGGRLMVLEFGTPTLPIFRSLYRFYAQYCIPLIGGLLTHNRDAYQYLPRTSAAFPYGHDFIKLLQAAEFERSYYRPLLSGIAYVYIGTKSMSLLAEGESFHSPSSMMR